MTGVKRLLLWLAMLCVAGHGWAEDGVPADYDAERAEALGADDYGMRSYVLAFLKAGPNRGGDREEALAIQRAHLDYIGQLAEEGKLIAAGPFLGAGDLRGIFLFAVASVEEAQALAERDPAVAAGRLQLELHGWYGPAGLMALPEIQSRITRSRP